MHAKVFSIQIFQYFSQIVPRVCTLVLFILCIISVLPAHLFEMLSFFFFQTFVVYYISPILLQYGTSKTVHIPSTDSATIDISPNNTQDTDCGDFTKETMNCTFNTTSSTMYTVVITTSNVVGSNSSHLTFDCKLWE